MTDFIERRECPECGAEVESQLFPAKVRYHFMPDCSCPDPVTVRYVREGRITKAMVKRAWNAYWDASPPFTAAGSTRAMRAALDAALNGGDPSLVSRCDPTNHKEEPDG